MAVTDPITMEDALNLKSIQKKLNLPFSKLAKANKLLRDPNLTDDEKSRVLLGVPEGVETYDFLESRLTEAEMVSIGKFVKLPPR